MGKKRRISEDSQHAGTGRRPGLEGRVPALEADVHVSLGNEYTRGRRALSSGNGKVSCLGGQG
jgi:hypothetical protein